MSAICSSHGNHIPESISILGVCTSSSCSACNILYEGKGCCTKWDTYKGWSKLFWTYDAITIAITLTLLLATVYQVYLFKLSRMGKTKWTLVSQCLLCVFFYLLIRILYYTIDPHGIREIFSTEVEAVLFWLPLWFLLIAAFLIVLYWVELQHDFMNMRELPSINKLRPALYACGAVAAVTILPLGIANAVVYSTIVSLLLNVVLAIVLLSLAVFSSYYGYNLLRLLKNLIRPKEEFIKRITWFALGVNAFLVSAIIIIIAYVIRGREAYSWVVIQWLLRTCELGGVACVVLLLRKKRPPPGSSSNNSSSKQRSADATIEIKTINETT